MIVEGYVRRLESGTAVLPCRAALVVLLALGTITGCRRIGPDAHPAIPVFPGYSGDASSEIVPIDFGNGSLQAVTHDGRDRLFALVLDRPDGIQSTDNAHGPIELDVFESGALVRRHSVAGEYRRGVLFHDANGTVNAWLYLSESEIASNGGHDYRVVVLRPPYDRAEVEEAARNDMPETPDETYVSVERPDPRVTRFDVVAVERWWPNYRANFLPAYREIQYFRATLDGHAFEYKLDGRRETESTWVVGPLRDDPHGLWFLHEKLVDGANHCTLYRARVRR